MYIWRVCVNTKKEKERDRERYKYYMIYADLCLNSAVCQVLAETLKMSTRNPWKMSTNLAPKIQNKESHMTKKNIN